MKRFLSILLLTLSFILPGRAGIVYSGTQNISIPLSGGGVYLNIYTAATASSEPGTWNSAPWMNPFWGGVDFGNDNLLRPAINAPTDPYNPDTIVNLGYGTVINNSLNLTGAENISLSHTAGVATPEKFTLGTPGYIGFAFEPNIGGSTYYGWAQVLFNNGGTNAAIIDWAYNDTPGASINAGAVPEPGRAMLLLMGAMAFALRRRRK